MTSNDRASAGGEADGELTAVLSIARRAAAVVRAVYATPFTVELKGPNDPVTRADREANEIICDALAAAFPGDGILAEESVPASPEEVARLAGKERVWFVDPLDGTREFADKREGEFCVMIGLAERGRAALGVVVMPGSGEALCGRVGRGAFAEDAAGARRALAVSAISDPREATIMVSRSHRPAIVDPLIAALGVRRAVPCGSVGVKISRLLMGEGDLYVHGGIGAKRWDTCAPEAILTAAGGRFSDLTGAPLDYTSADLILRSGLVATNGALHDAVLAALAAAEQKR